MSAGLSYGQIGLLISVPLLVGSLIELPLGLVAGQGRVRHRLVLAGGVVVAGSLAAVAVAHSFGVLLVALVAFFPASGAFVSLTQAALMDAAPARHQQRMAAWNLAGSTGAVGGPLLLAGVLAGGGDWRMAYYLLAAVAVAALAVALFAAPSRQPLAPATPRQHAATAVATATVVAAPADTADAADTDNATATAATADTNNATATAATAATDNTAAAATEDGKRPVNRPGFRS